jgi:sugar-specific transcriptional regulator TrmB
MSKRLEILRSSLQKKEAAFNESLEQHFESVKQANGQPLNDKRNGQSTINKWERQNQSLRNLNTSIEKTKAAIENETYSIVWKQEQREKLPSAIITLIDSGELKQWQKHPNTFFVTGVEKARIVWDEKKKQVSHKFTSAITDKEQWAQFARTFNNLKAAL